MIEGPSKGRGINHIGMPAALYLDYFGIEVYEAFGDHPYLVGSATRSASWRDVDVRLILPDEEFNALFGKMPHPRCENLKWNALCLAFAALGERMTGLPIDFQIDRRTEANAQHAGKERIPLGHHIWMRRREDAR